MRHSKTYGRLISILSAAQLVLALSQAALAFQEQQASPEDVKQAKLSQTAFTYQGQLKDAVGSVNGVYDFQFTLYSAQADGDVLGVSEIKEVTLANGMFSFKLDFGRAGVETKESWLEIGVRPSGSAEAYTVLFPRQKLTPTPYAIFAQHDQWSLIGVPVGFADRALIGEAETVGTETDFDKQSKHTDKKDKVTPEEKTTEAVAAVGAAGTIAKFVDTINLGDSVIKELNGRVVIGGAASPTPTDVPLLRLTGNARTDNVAVTFNNIGVDGKAWRIGTGFQGGDTVGKFFISELQAGVAPFESVNRLTIENGTGHIGIGTTTPFGNLEIAGFSPFITLRETQQGRNEPAHIQNAGGSIVFKSTGFGFNDAAMVIRKGDGLVTVKNLFIQGGADLSENFDVKVSETPGRDASPEDVQPGMVVAIDAKNPGKLIVTHQAHDRRVAGIVSGAGGVKPGMVMGQSGSVADGLHPVALTGRVYCLVDASFGAIEPGDLLTSSPTPGHAMKVTNHKKARGAIIGKAMTALSKGRGLVLVIVTLQ